MTLRELQYLRELARLRNFGRAAEACGVSQPTLSTQLRKLEEELGVQLIERAPRRIMLTPVGEEIVMRAERVLGEVEQIREIARSNRAPETGLLRLGVFPTLGPYLLPHLVPEIRARLPRIDLQLVEEKSDLLLERLRDGRLDVALLALPLEVDDPQLQVVELFEEPFLLAVPCDDPRALGGPIDSASLSDCELMLLEDGHCLRNQAVSLCQRCGAHETQGFRATSLETLRQMVAAGMGITLMPKLAALGPLAGNGQIRLLEFRDDPPPSRHIGMVWRRSSAMAPMLRGLSRILRDTARPLLDQPLAPPAVPMPPPRLTQGALRGAPKL